MRVVDIVRGWIQRPDLALDFRADSIGLYQRHGKSWRQLRAANLAADDFDQRVAQLSDLARQLTGGAGVELWLPSDQVLSRRLRLEGTVFTRRSRARAALTKMTGADGADLSFDLAATPSGVWSLCAADKEVVAEARAYAAKWGFTPLKVSTRHADKAFIAGPDLAGGGRRRSFVFAGAGAAAVGAAALAALLSTSELTPVAPALHAPTKVALEPEMLRPQTAVDAPAGPTRQLDGAAMPRPLTAARPVHLAEAASSDPDADAPVLSSAPQTIAPGAGPDDTGRIQYDQAAPAATIEALADTASAPGRAGAEVPSAPPADPPASFAAPPDLGRAALATAAPRGLDRLRSAKFARPPDAGSGAPAKAAAPAAGADAALNAPDVDISPATTVNAATDAPRAAPPAPTVFAAPGFVIDAPARPADRNPATDMGAGEAPLSAGLRPDPAPVIVDPPIIAAVQIGSPTPGADPIAIMLATASDVPEATTEPILLAHADIRPARLAPPSQPFMEFGEGDELAFRIEHAPTPPEMAARPADDLARKADEIDPPGPGSVDSAPRPGPRPRSLDMTPSKLATLSSPKPGARPKSIKPRNAPPPGAEGTTIVKAPVRQRPAGKGAVNAATLRKVLPLSEASLLGVFGKSGSRRALLRLPDGEIRRVEKGAVVDGWVVTRIEATSMRMTKGGQVRSLPLVK